MCRAALSVGPFYGWDGCSDTCGLCQKESSSRNTYRPNPASSGVALRFAVAGGADWMSFWPQIPEGATTSPWDCMEQAANWQGWRCLEGSSLRDAWKSRDLAITEPGKRKSLSWEKIFLSKWGACGRGEHNNHLSSWAICWWYDCVDPTESFCNPVCNQQAAPGVWHNEHWWFRLPGFS